MKLLVKSHNLGNWRLEKDEKKYECYACGKEINDWNHIQDCDNIIIQTDK